MGIYYSLILDYMGKVVSEMKNFMISDSVSLFNFLIALAVVSIVVTYLVNVARSPRVTTTTADRARKERSNKK